jgi:hypothetical protein
MSKNDNIDVATGPSHYKYTVVIPKNSGMGNWLLLHNVTYIKNQLVGVADAHDIFFKVTRDAAVFETIYAEFIIKSFNKINYGPNPSS